MGCLHLYVPDKPLDPALKSLVERDRFRKRRIELESRLGALQLYEQAFSGESTNMRCDLLKDELEALGTQPQVPSVFRPEITELPRLQGELTNLLNSIVRKSPSNGQIHAAILGDLQAAQGLHLMRKNLEQVVLRLSANHRPYDDITKPIVRLLRGLDTGLALALVAGTTCSRSEKAIHQVYACTPFMGLQPRYFDHRIHMQDSKDERDALWSTNLRLSSIEGVVLGKRQLSSIEPALQILQSYYEDWKRQLTKDQHEYSAKVSLYRYRGNEEDNDSATDAEFDDIFPGYDESAQEGTVPGSRNPKDTQIWARRLADYHQSVFDSNADPANDLLRIISDTSNDMVHSWKNQATASLFPIASKEMLSSLVLSLHTTSQHLLYPAETGRLYNFYVDSNLIEARRLVDLLSRVQNKFKVLQQQWPEHATLEDVLRTSNELLLFKHVEPVAKIIIKCEQLYGYIHEWQTIASKEHSVAPVYNELTELLVSWRQLELSTWARLLDMEDRRCTEDAKGWWLVAYETIIAASTSSVQPGGDLLKHAEGLIATLESFLKQTSIGQFSERLRLLETFRNHLDILAVKKPSLRLAHDALTNCLVFYARFEPGIRDSLLKGRQLLAKNMKEVLLLASWKDTNIIALRESAKRSHHKLFKIIRKYRALLAQPAETTIGQGIPQLQTSHIWSDSLRDRSVAVLDETAVEFCRQTFPGWSNKPSRYIDSNNIVLRMKLLAAEPTSAFDCPLYIESFSTQLTDTIIVLQNETPSVLTVENKDAVKHLKSRKRKMFADTLKEIREMGMTSNPSTDILGRQGSLSLVLSAIPALSSTLFPGRINKAEYYLHRSLENMVTIRALAKEHSEDLSNSERARSIGLLESMLNVALKQRATLAPAMDQFETFHASTAKVQNLWAPKKYSLQREGSAKHLLPVTLLERCIRWLPTIIKVGITIVQRHAALGGFDSAVVIGALGRWRQIIEEIIKDISELPVLPTGITSSLHLQLWKDSNATLERFTEELNVLKLQIPLTGFVLDQILLWTSPSTAQVDRFPNSVHSVSIENIDKAISTIVDTILVGTQRLDNTLAALSTSCETGGWLLRADIIHSKSIKVLHISNITYQVDAVLSQLQDLPTFPSQDLSIAGALCTVAMPIIKQYGNIYGERVERYLDLHGSTCRMLCVLSTSFTQIVQQGYCSPSEKSAPEDGKTEKLEGGTGLGEGEGAEDISKDIQEDEDLSELAQEHRKEQNKENIEDEKEAVDMMHDELEGELGEGAESAEEDGSDKGSDYSRENIDEEAGEVDDLNPSAVDEKLWDGSREDTEREKEGNKSRGGKQEELAAPDDQLEKDENEIPNPEEANKTGADESEEVAQEDVETTDPHLQEGQNLDLPEEMDLGRDIESIGDSDDELMKDMSDIDQDEKDEADTGDNDSIENTAEDPEGNKQEDQSMQENLDDTSRIENAGSPMDTEPEDDTDHEDQGLLRDRTDDAAVDADSAAQNDVRGVGESAQSQNETQDQTDKMAESERDANDGLNSAHDTQAEAEEGESGSAVAALETSQGQQDSVQELCEIEAFKKLGDALEDWHRQSRNIRRADNDDPRIQSETMGVDNLDADFEHLPNENAEADAQALGAATEDQAEGLDPRTFDSEMQDQHKEFLADEASADDANDQAMEDTVQTSQTMEDQDRPLRVSAINSHTSQQDRPSQGNAVEGEQKQDIDELDNDLSTVHLATEAGVPYRSLEDARDLWSHYENLTRDLALTLTEQLRLILAPTLATKMRGDFRTGKRLNIKRIIPYIASQYKRDKIWMRRSVPSKRNYQIMLAVDDSRSMGESESGQLAFETLALVSKSLSMLEVGQICIVGFGNDVHVAHNFDQTFSSEAGVQVFQQFGFQQTRTNVRKLIADSIELFRDARSKAFNSGADLWQLELIISDGVCEDHESIRRLVRQAHEERIMIVFVIVDTLKGESIMDITQATFEPDESGETKLNIKRYLDGFPFGYYLVVGNVKELPGVLATALRQWFAEVVESG